MKRTFRPLQFALALTFGALVLVACSRPTVELGPPPNLDGLLTPLAANTPVAAGLPGPPMILPTMAPAPATRNPIGLPPVKVATAAAHPAQLRIQAIGVDLSISESALTPNRELAAPTDGFGVVWYKDGATPGMRGNAVLTGHLDWSGKPGAFFRLRELAKGDIIQIWAKDGSLYLYTVDSVEVYAAADAPVTEIMGARETPLLTLITCDGTFNYATHDYSHRRVVRATWY